MNEIKGDVQRMVKRRKDSGFTLIELMIVIAVIGILAIVLVPKVGGVKTAAKDAGLDVNIRTVQAYAESQITKWSKNSAAQGTVDSEIAGAMTSGSNQMKNPYGTGSAFVTGAAPSGTGTDTGTPGAVYVKVSTSTPYTVTICGYNSKGELYNSVSVTP
ncbi:type II secretion system protein [Desulfitobacterium sp.]|uniref:type II secretion system protein n=1 Tax=Desulfitobacterium sp. TaxID=49981 RepID=UPI002B21CBD3|nr:type II secretion system protein [Desulfitobacterium sp.]MEA4900441.1 type II secretion system protein [Desulfitobacterium sp.]